jgi:hypothetical protein
MALFFTKRLWFCAPVFYEKSGFVTIGASFTEVTIPHKKMVKGLALEA